MRSCYFCHLLVDIRVCGTCRHVRECTCVRGVRENRQENNKNGSCKERERLDSLLWFLWSVKGTRRGTPTSRWWRQQPVKILLSCVSHPCSVLWSFLEVGIFRRGYQNCDTFYWDLFHCICTWWLSTLVGSLWFLALDCDYTGLPGRSRHRRLCPGLWLECRWFEIPSGSYSPEQLERKR